MTDEEQLYRCPSCDQTGAFIQEYAVVEEEHNTVLGTVKRPDYDTQLMECNNDCCRVDRFEPWGDDE